MSNLTQFFGAVPSTASTATPIVGTTMQDLTAGDGVRLADNGEFVKSSKAAMVKGQYTVNSSTDRSSVANDGLNMQSDATHGQYVPYSNNPRGIVLSDGTYIQLFFRYYQNANAANDYCFRSFVMSNDEDHMTFKHLITRPTPITNFYYDQGCIFKEIYKDADFIHVAADVIWAKNNNYHYIHQHIIKMNRSTKVMTVVKAPNEHRAQRGSQSMGHTGGGGSVGILANGVLVNSWDEVTGANYYKGRLTIISTLYNTANPQTPSITGAYNGAYPDWNHSNTDLLLHDHDTRTFISFEAPVYANNSKLVKKHVFAADGSVTTTTVSTAFTLSNFTNAQTNLLFRVVNVSAGIYAAIFAESANVWSFQKFSWDGNTTLTQVGNRIDMTLPTGLNIQDAGSSSMWYHHHAYTVAGKESDLIIQHSHGTTAATNDRMNVYSINCLTGTLNFARTTAGLGDVGKHSGGLMIGNTRSLAIIDHDDYNDFNYQKYESAFFKANTLSKEIVGVAITNADAGSTTASIALFDGLQSTTALPAGTYVQKNGQYYLQDIEGSVLGEVEIKSTGAVSNGGDNTGYLATQPNQLGIATSMGSTANYWNGPAGNTAGTTGWGTYKGTGGTVWADARFNYYIFPHRYTAVCPANVTTDLVSISGRGRLLDRFVFANGHSNSYTAGWELWIDGVRWYYQNTRSMTQGTAGYYSVINFEYMTGVPYLDFKDSMVFKCVSPTTTNVTNYCFFRLGKRG